MKQVLLIAFLCLVCSSFMIAQGDSTESYTKIKEVYVSGGISYPYLPLEFRHHSMKGTNFGIGYTVSFEPGSVGYSSLSLTADYNIFRFDEKGFLTDVHDADTNIIPSHPGLTISQRPVKALNVMFNYRGTFTPFGKTVAPYFLLGAGYMYLSEPQTVAALDTALNISESSQSTFAWSFGAGLDFSFTESAGLFIQIKSILGTLTEPRQYFPLSAGVHFRL